jgi:hypothetical protein
VDPHRLRDAAQLTRTDLLQLDLGPVHRELHRIGEPDLAGRGLVLEAGGDVDRLAEDVASLEPHLAQVDGHADHEPFGLG